MAKLLQMHSIILLALSIILLITSLKNSLVTTRPGSFYYISIDFALVYSFLLNVCYSNLCKLAFGIQLINQHRITLANVCKTHQVLLLFAQEFEILYCQCLPTRIGLASIHSILHLLHKVTHIGPPVCSSQWTPECTIGNLREEIKQHPNSFANLSQCGIQCARVNALKAMILDLDIEWTSKEYFPQGSKDVR